MTTDKINMLRSFVESLEANDNIFKQSVLEALDAFESEEQAMQEAITDPLGRRMDDFGIPKLATEIQWTSMQTELKDFVGDDSANDMLVILRNNAGGTYIVFKKGSKVEFVTCALNEKESETEEPERSKFLGKNAINTANSLPNLANLH